MSCYKLKRPSKETLLFKEFTPFFGIKENVFHAREKALGGQFCQACGHLVEFTTKGPLYLRPTYMRECSRMGPIQLIEIQVKLVINFKVNRSSLLILFDE